MEIPENVQDKLKCNECDELLSCGPVYLLHETGANICGRCSQQSKDDTENSKKSRNEPYEAAASLLAFPCAFANEGCPEKVQFTLGQQPPHESSCKFRPFVCPVAPHGSCEWIGSWLNLKEHCVENHPTKVLENPGQLSRPDLTTANLQTYVISAFHFLFLLHVKVCVSSGKLFHSMRMFGDPEMLDTFSYSLKIEGNDSKVIKNGSVLRPGILAIQEPTANFVLINSLLDLLSGQYNESKFTITIQSLIKFCLNCSKNINDSNLEFCEECEGKIVKCEFNENGCLFVDVNKKKCEKHASLFCEKQRKCYKCKVNLVGGSFIEHFSSSSSCRKTIKSSIDSVVRVTNTKHKFNNILFSCNNIGTIMCECYLSNSNFQLNLYTSLPSHELKNFKCSIELTDPQTKHTLLLTPQIQYNDWWDWSTSEKMDNFPSWRNIGILIKINVDKI